MIIPLDGRSLTLHQLASVARENARVVLDDAARARVAAARHVVDRAADGDVAVYGVNTGFGSFADVRIPQDALSTLQANLLRSHAAGVGDPLPVQAIRATMALRANVLARGSSGVRVETLEALIALLNAGVHPVVPCRGSVGASGDLAPLAHLALVLVGEGETLGPDGRLPGAVALERNGLVPIQLKPKEGLALINGTQPSTAILALAVLDAERVAHAADVAAALSIDGLRGSTKPFDPRIHAARPFRGQQQSAGIIGTLLAGSPINASHADCGRVQDAYSMRCAPQVHGAARDALAFVRHVVSVELNAATDNPMVFAEEGDLVSGGNFHGAPVALAADLLAIGVTHLATISERRSDRLVNPALSGLPPFLTRNGGLESGLMMAQVTAAALTSELKGLAHPASVDTIPTSGNKEDHVSMSMTAALKAERAVGLARQVTAIELLCATQAIDLLAPLTTSPLLADACRIVRARVPTLDKDRSPAPDIAAIDELIADGAFDHLPGAVVK
jgi:histidine ammonia-lyase